MPSSPSQARHGPFQPDHRNRSVSVPLCLLVCVAMLYFLSVVRPASSSILLHEDAPTRSTRALAQSTINNEHANSGFTSPTDAGSSSGSSSTDGGGGGALYNTNRSLASSRFRSRPRRLDGALADGQPVSWKLSRLGLGDRRYRGIEDPVGQALRDGSAKTMSNGSPILSSRETHHDSSRRATTAAYIPPAATGDLQAKLRRLYDEPRIAHWNDDTVRSVQALPGSRAQRAVRDHERLSEREEQDQNGFVPVAEFDMHRHMDAEHELLLREHDRGRIHLRESIERRLGSFKSVPQLIGELTPAPPPRVTHSADIAARLKAADDQKRRIHAGEDARFDRVVIMGREVLVPKRH